MYFIATRVGHNRCYLTRYIEDCEHISKSVHGAADASVIRSKASVNEFGNCRAPMTIKTATITSNFIEKAEGSMTAHFEWALCLLGILFSSGRGGGGVKDTLKTWAPVTECEVS